MGWSFRKRVKIIPGVHLNFSRSGISTSIGVRGANVTIGNNGTFLNMGIPGTGIYNRHRLSQSSNPTIVSVSEPIISNSDNIFSADIHEITSQNMQGIKESIILANKQRNELQNDLLKLKVSLNSSKLKKNLSFALIYGFINKQIPRNINSDIIAKEDAIRQIQRYIDDSYVNLDIEFDPYVKEKYNKLVESFVKLSTSHKIWDVTSAHFQDRVTTRSSASTLVKKKEVRFSLKSLPDIKSDFPALYFRNANGADLYFYPSFIIMYSSKNQFAIIGIDEIVLTQSYVRFTETSSVPKDSKVISKTWAKVNKNGTQDKRFKGNYQIPVVKYGNIKLYTNTGLNEEYEFSNYEFTEQFGESFHDYQILIKSLI